MTQLRIKPLTSIEPLRTNLQLPMQEYQELDINTRTEMLKKATGTMHMLELQQKITSKTNNQQLAQLTHIEPLLNTELLKEGVLS